MRIRAFIVAAALLAAPAAAEQYQVRLAPRTPDTLTRLKLFVDAPVGSSGLYGSGSGAFDLPGRVPASGTATFQKVPVRLRVSGRTFAGLATVNFRNGAFEGLVAESMGSDGSPLDAVLRLNGNQYAFGADGNTLTGAVSAGPAGDPIATPEPSTWAMLILGIAMVGAAIRFASATAGKSEQL